VRALFYDDATSGGAVRAPHPEQIAQTEKDKKALAASRATPTCTTRTCQPGCRDHLPGAGDRREVDVIIPRAHSEAYARAIPVRCCATCHAPPWDAPRTSG